MRSMRVSTTGRVGGGMFRPAAASPDCCCELADCHADDWLGIGWAKEPANPVPPGKLSPGADSEIKARLGKLSRLKLEPHPDCSNVPVHVCSGARADACSACERDVLARRLNEPSEVGRPILSRPTCRLRELCARPRTCKQHLLDLFRCGQPRCLRSLLPAAGPKARSAGARCGSIRLGSRPRAGA